TRPPCLARPLSSCRSHDPTSDPLPTRDYSRVQAVFAPAQFDERAVPFLPCENTAGFAEAAAKVRERIKLNQTRLQGLAGKPKDEQEELRRTYRKRLQYLDLEARR